jgi:hypothetical protein
MQRMIGPMALVGLLALGACAAQSQRMDQPAEAIVGVPLTQSAAAPDAWSYMAPETDLRTYTRFIVAPPVVFSGEGSSYGDLSPAEVQEIAQMFVDQTKLALAPAFPVVTEPGPGVARLTFTLVAVSPTVPYVSTATRIIPVGAAINLLKGGTTGGGTLTGGVTYGIEARDSVSGQVLAAAVRHLTPAAFDLDATLGTMETAEATARTAAQMLRARLDALHKR